MATRKKRNPILLPEDIIYNILLWLHVKDLLRFTSVCKSWLSIISSRDFVKTHLSKSTNDPHFTHHHLLLRVEPDGYNLDLKSLSVYTVLNEPVTKSIKLNYPTKGSAGKVLGYVEGYCHGLVCLTTKINDHDKHVHLWNPTTRKSRTLPKLDMIDDCGRIVYGFCYDESNDDYKVFINFASRLFENKYKVSVYSSKSDSWRMIGDFPFEGTMYDSGKFANGAMHWIFRRLNTKCNNPKAMTIVSLDIKTETYQEILQPKYRKGACNWTLHTFGESLSILRKYKTRAEFWVLIKECGLEVSWTKLFTYLYKKRQTGDSDLDPISISVNGYIILNFGSEINLYNSKDNTFKKLFYGILDNHLTDVDTYVESLVSPYL